MKICLVCSHGGHLTEMLQVMKAFEGQEVFFATYHSSREEELKGIAKVYSMENVGTNIFRMLRCVPWALRILWKEKPGVIISLGAEIAIPFFFLSRLLRIKTVFIESWCRVTSPSRTGRIVYPVSDVFLVQWEQLLQVYGSKAEYHGAVL